MAHLLESSGLHFQIPKATLFRSNQSLFHGRNRPVLVSFNKDSTRMQPISTFNCRPISSSVKISNRAEAGMNFFRKKRSQKQSKNLQSILIRSALYFVSKQNFLFDILLNNWSEFDKNVLNPDDNGGRGGGFTFIPGLGGGDGDNFSRKRRKSSWKWWWVLTAAAVIFILVVFSESLEGLVIKTASFGLFALILLGIVGSVALAGSILIASLRFLMKKSKFILFPPKRKHDLSLSKSITAGTLLSTMVLSILFPQIPKALVGGGGWCSVRQLKKTTDSQMKAYWKRIERAHKKFRVMLNAAIKRGSR